MNINPTTKRWLWFIGLWFASVAVVSTIAYIIKWLMSFAG